MEKSTEAAVFPLQASRCADVISFYKFHQPFFENSFSIIQVNVNKNIFFLICIPFLGSSIELVTCL